MFFSLSSSLHIDLITRVITIGIFIKRPEGVMHTTMLSRRKKNQETIEYSFFLYTHTIVYGVKLTLKSSQRGQFDTEEKQRYL